ncbi:small CPxCG-related zinc finger protein [Halalkaliarchaeum desulfuricum]|uniref:Small CPxCG-related zinc finger protein n=1 Tax=Halalkaliarchaeum desulfuricum TaxID=2055893 RepID=A0A343TP48_9EURY|nr:hypothetical protein [Halalkaliarchaeum desulfuricum]AUX10870.1 small CPxCG-related zinc finger protein [Halalkaliarchaeum desulfuricum]
MSQDEEALIANLEIGQEIYDEDGNELGTVRGLDDNGFYVLAREETGTVPLSKARDIFGKAYVMWRCWECGEMGKIEDDLPDTCPSCGAQKEELYYWAED